VRAVRCLRSTVAAMAVAGVAVACSGAPSPATETAVPATSPSTLDPSGPTPPPNPSADATTPSPSPATFLGPDTMPSLHPSVDDYPQGRATLQLADGVTWDIPILIAATEDDRSHGLMEVPDVPSATGMAFIFEQDLSCCFWMKGTETDLDIAWFSGDGTVVGMTTMTVCRTENCPLYRPLTDTTYRHALEVRAGWLAEIGLAIGDRIELVDVSGLRPVPS